MAKYVADTSVLVDGRIREVVQAGDLVLVPRQAIAELESQANQGKETGFTGLHELRMLREEAEESGYDVHYIGEDPSPSQIAHASQGAIDRAIRRLAYQEGATLVTADRVLGYAARAEGIEVELLKPDQVDLDEDELPLQAYFDDETMSVHLRAGQAPMAKRGRPGEVEYEEIGEEILTPSELRELIRDIVEFASRDDDSYVELERKGCSVLQVRNMRITIAKPPFSDALEITAVRPVARLSLDDYSPHDDLLARLEDGNRGVFVAGPPGSGKSTFVAALGTHLHELGRVVKTMEQPRDLQVPAEVTQYGALDGDMQWTGEIMLLVRPDNVLYDEVRTTKDFKVFADMRLAGVGLIGVTHANRAIDAIQRLIGRVELGMIPQVVDTVVFIDRGEIGDVYELETTVRTPRGMQDDALARPVIVVREVLSGQERFEIYSFGEQVVVMPIGPGGRAAVPAPNRRGRGQDRRGDSPMQRQLIRALRTHANGRIEAQVKGRHATVQVEDWDVGNFVRVAAKTIRLMERRQGLLINVEALPSQGEGGRGPPGRVDAIPTKARSDARIHQVGANVFVEVGPEMIGREVAVLVEDSQVGFGTVNQQGRVRFKNKSTEGQILKQAKAKGLMVSVRMG